MRAWARAWVLLGWLALPGCEEAAETPASPAPVNACGGMTGQNCSGFRPDAGVQCLPTGDAATCEPGTSAACVCQVGAVVNPVDPSVVLVVSVPALAPSAGGVTFPISLQDLFNPVSTSPNACLDYALGPPDVCYQLTAPQVASGEYLIAESQAVEANRYLGDLGGNSFTLPVTVTFWPMWTPPDTATSQGVATDVRLLNLPLPPVFADVGCGVAPVDIGFTGVSSLCRPQGTGFEWLAGLAPSDSIPAYSTVVDVVSPFNYAFPDLSYPVSVDGANPELLRGALLGLLSSGNSTNVPAPIEQWPPPDPMLPNGLTVSRADGEPFAEGWTVYVRNPTTNQAITSRAAIRGASFSTRLNYITTQPVPTTNVEVVVEPPPGVTGLPTYINPDTTGIEKYPALPPIAHVTGTVVSPYGDPVSATLLFYSNQIDDVRTCTLAAQGQTKPGGLFYEARAQTDDQISPSGAVGQFNVDLPQGLYSVVVEPLGGSFYAKYTEQYVTIAHVPPFCSGPSPTVSVTIPVSLPVDVTGTFFTADGRPLAGASVDFTPAAALAATLSPLVNNVGGVVCPLSGCSEVWPRPFTTTTTTAGTFRVDVDPGLYDVTARPADGTGWPWLVWPSHTFSGQPASDGGTASAFTDAGSQQAPFIQPLEPMVVPPPFFLSVSLLDPEMNALAGAEVLAYSFSNGVAINIGQAVTDVNGHFAMMLTTAFPSN